MCGIAAILSTRKNIPENSINAMTTALIHRGPDARNIARFDRCHLGHTRLSIIDLAGGTQPMTDGTGRYSIVFNGEIYNYRQLRRDLERQGEKFQTESDTEVLLKAYTVYGEDALSRLNGQFAFALWDRQEETLFAARDRLGEKPFYYADYDGYFLIASEIKALLAPSLFRPELDPISIDAYLTLLYVPPDRSIYRNIHALPPAHALTWRSGEIERSRYWQPRYSRDSLDPGEAIEQIKTLLDRAVERQMIADVPVGAFLSGGLDSSTIVALMARHTDRPIQTFSVGFGDLINELPYARSVARQYRTEHFELQMDIPVGEMLEKMAVVYDEPFADSSNIPTYLLAEFARRQVTVVLSGDGGDELFGGYEWYDWLLSEGRSLTSAKLQQLFWSALVKFGLPGRGRRQKALDYYHLATLENRYPDRWERHLAFATGWKDTHPLLGRERGESQSQIRESYYPGEELQDMDRVSDFDLRCYLPGDILVKVDRATMASGLESRSPFLDADLVEFVLNLPWRLRFRDRNRKYLLRQAYENLWPADLQKRAKQGFGAPIAHWLDRPDVKVLVRRVCQAASPLAYLFPRVGDGIAGLSPQNRWTILCLGLWLEGRSACLTSPR
jgi:asparagine synthase (glutamine-hydrolysing)